MMASISCVLLFFLHRRLVRKRVSFGHLDAPYMIGACGGVGLLITKRFWSPWLQHKRFFLMLLLSIVFTLALNPASAILVEDTKNNNRHFQITELDTPKMIGTSEFSDYQNNVIDFVGTFHSMLIVDGMARFASWLWKPFLEIPLTTGDGYKYVNLIGANRIAQTYRADQVFLNSTKADAFSIEFEASRYGYGYGFRSDDTGVSIYLAISILSIYELITILYVVTIFWYRCSGRYTRSQAWEAMINLIALAKNSEASPYLVGTCAGIKKWDTWKLKVKVRAMEDDRLNLAFMRRDENLGEEPGIMKKYE